ncbi:hypothetical protein CW354_07785 [Marinicaulis flavus]|uniref:Uncharacterized protein n=2 Tax=Hyphococcus luteus TaxID=2058213 RepID=A0A2S7K6W2_9PROT|nr:hypothetical protein CW354_07785 [Marinicaulis flavus]
MFKSESDGWVEVYADSSKQPDEYGQHAGSAMTVKGQDFEIDGNIFLFPVRQDKFLDTEFIVVAYNDEKTSIRVRPDTDDRFAFLEVMTEIDGRRERALDFSSMMPGARAHVGDAIYELHKDGWYLGETKISATNSR